MSLPLILVLVTFDPGDGDRRDRREAEGVVGVGGGAADRVVRPADPDAGAVVAAVEAARDRAEDVLSIVAAPAAAMPAVVFRLNMSVATALVPMIVPVTPAATLTPVAFGSAVMPSAASPRSYRPP